MYSAVSAFTPLTGIRIRIQRISDENTMDGSVSTNSDKPISTSCNPRGESIHGGTDTSEEPRPTLLSPGLSGSSGLPEVPPPAYADATGAAASVYPQCNVNPSAPPHPYLPPAGEHHSEDRNAITVSEISPPSYTFVTGSGMQQFDRDLPPPSHQKELTTTDTNQSCQLCCSFMCSFAGHAGFIICIVFLIRELTWPSQSSDVIVPVTATFMVVSYVLIIIESSCSNTKRYIKNCVSLETLYQFIDGLKNERPALTWHICCYHYETRYRTVSYTDSRGNTQYRTESYQEKVVTHTDDLQFQFTHWRDVTPEFPAFGRGDVSRVQFHRAYCFIDQCAQEMYEGQKRQFHDENVNRDKYMTLTESYEIAGFKERMSAYANEESVRCCMEERWFWVTTLLLVNPFYRCWYSNATTKTSFSIVKEFGV